VQEEGVVTVANPCLSGGSLEVFLEPVVPPARLVVVGSTPVAAALVALGVPLGFAVEAWPEAGDLAGAAAVVVASHGRGEEPALEAALAAGRAVRRAGGQSGAGRGGAWLPRGAGRRPGAQPGRAGPRLPHRSRDRAVDLGGGRRDPRRGPAAEPVAVEPTTAVDPVCGMTVAVSAAVPQARSLG
jgi:xanthine dehydrogenase accessory factor